MEVEGELSLASEKGDENAEKVRVRKEVAWKEMALRFSGGGK